MTTERDLIRRLADDLQEARDAVADWASYASEYFQQKHDLQAELDRINARIEMARAYLATPEPTAGPNERDVSEWIDSLPLWHGATRDELTGIVLRAFARWGNQHEAQPTDEEIDAWHTECADLTRAGTAEHYWAFEVGTDYVVNIVRGALSRWGHRPQPIALSDRLPGPEDCDGDCCIWLWVPDLNGHVGLGHWERQHRDWATDPDGDATHWLPYHALPLPEQP